MSYIYAMSDIHGCLEAFEYALSLVDFSGDNKLVLLGDYVHGPDSYGVLKRIMQLQNKPYYVYMTAGANKFCLTNSLYILCSLGHAAALVGISGLA